MDGALTASKLVEAISHELHLLSGFDEQFAALVQSARHEQSGRQASHWKQVELDEQVLAREKENLLNTILQCGPMLQMEPLRHRWGCSRFPDCEAKRDFI